MGAVQNRITEGTVEVLLKKSEIKKLDKLWAKAVKIRANQKCEYCLREDLKLDAAHIVGRVYRGTRWDLANGISLCYRDHQDFDNNGPESQKIFDNLIGQEKYDQLVEKAKHTITKHQDYEEIRETLDEAGRASQ